MRTTHRRRPATPAESARALANVRKLFAMTPRERAEERMRRAKASMDVAAQAVLDNDPEAAEMGDRALAELRSAQAELAALDTRKDA